MRHSGSYFELTDRFASRAGTATSSGPANRPQAGNDNDSPGPESAKSMNCTLVISVAKRLVPSAVRRNTVKRVVREAWRAAHADAGGTSARAGRLPVVCLMRLKRYPGEAPGSKAGPGGRRLAGSQTPAPGAAMVKRQLRADADKLFEAFLHGRSRLCGSNGSNG